jgi:hypothetical protein
MTATVLNWDGYLWAIAQRPLRSFWRSVRAAWLDN